MGEQADPWECPGHDWQPVAMELRLDGSWTTYECRWCQQERMVGPGDEHPSGGED